MIIDFTNLTPNECYFAMVQAIVPRPIAWVLSLNSLNIHSQKPSFNLAPFSFFTGICSDPPLLMFSVGKKTEGDEGGRVKDTCANIRSHKRFVVHIANTPLLGPVNASAATLNYGVSEVEQLNLATVPFAGFALPRLKDCPIALACELYRLDEIGNTPQAVIYGQIVAMYVDDALLQQNISRLVIDSKALDPLMRLGGSSYGALGETLTANRPK